jgi:hypothetical protein
MRCGWITARTLKPGETDFEPWFLMASSLFGLGCLIWLGFGLPWPHCWVRHLLGIPCPTCGSTRSALALAHGNVGRAFQLNPLMCLVYLGVIGFDFYAAAVLIFRTKRIRFIAMPKSTQQIVASVIVAAVLVNWIYLLCTMR